MTNEDYLRQQLEWVKFRAAALEEIEAKLLKMRILAILARDNKMTPVETWDINTMLHDLQKEATQLDEQSRVFWSDYQ
ncbi:hypothetical protein [Desulfoscipio gibsoniae]|uniref:Uncharacterized protein n=1 Tax=Desulfoscipio gibsoniae DSM 7213 TaxID=767817 RepID=R4KEQ7_9FIRM|nr:hypothetical protein [Desulfoscipio gibsoniae]AGL01683.1 hypothetical protein Desgi_2257 [Desulfoscipio gibsoniae DSM 7213]